MVVLPKILGEDAGSKLQAMDQGDIQPQNIIMNADYNIVGYVR